MQNLLAFALENYMWFVFAAILVYMRVTHALTGTELTLVILGGIAGAILSLLLRISMAVDDIRRGRASAPAPRASSVNSKQIRELEQVRSRMIEVKHSVPGPDPDLDEQIAAISDTLEFLRTPDSIMGLR